MTRHLNEFIRVSPGFKAAVNLRKERDNLTKVAGYIPTEVAREIILDFAKKIHPATPDLRSRIIMGTYGTGKSHLALVLLNFFQRQLQTSELQTVIEKLDPDTRSVLQQYRNEVPHPYLIVNLYGNMGNISDSLMLGLRQALAEEGLENLLPTTAFDAAITRIDDLENQYPESFAILKSKAEENGQTVAELKTRLREYQRKAFELFCDIYPAATSGARFVYATMLDAATLYESVTKELRTRHGYSGIAVFWDEFGHKMEEVVKDPTGKEGLSLQDFAECCNASQENQMHLYLFCHRSLKEYHDISRASLAATYQQLEDDLRKIEGRFKQYVLKSTDVETFQLIEAVILADQESHGWNELEGAFGPYFDELAYETARLNYFVGFNREELKTKVVLGAYPLHPMAVYSLPAISEKVAQNNRTLFTCLSEDEPGSFKRFLDKAVLETTQPSPPMFTVDQLWDYFSRDIKQQERTYSIFRDFEQLRSRIRSEDKFGEQLLKAVSVFRVTNPTRFKITENVLIYALNILPDHQGEFKEELTRHCDLKNENHILMRLQSDGSYRPAVSSSTESLMEKVRKLIDETPEKLGQKPILHLTNLWPNLPVDGICEATGYGDDYGVYRQLKIEPISMYQLRERLHFLEKNLGQGEFLDGLILAVLCESSSEIEEAKAIGTSVLAEQGHEQVILALPKEPIQLSRLIMEHQALMHLRNNEASLYAEGGELHEEWKVWETDKYTQLAETIAGIFTPEKQALDYYWKGQLLTIQNSRELKRLASRVMREVFPFSPHIGDPKLAQDDFAGNWGYRKDCRDIAVKLATSTGAEDLWKESAAAPKHVINLLLVSNGLLHKNQTGEVVISQPNKDEHPAAHDVWGIITEYLKKARQRPVDVKTLVTRLRRPPFGIKCRTMPILFAAVAHHELVLGNVYFEYHRSAANIQTITKIESDTLEKVFSAPDNYRLVYVNVSSNQNALISGMAKVYNIELSSVDPALERVKKVGGAIGAWWRALPKHSQLTGWVSNEAKLLRDHIFKPLAELDPDAQQILLKDAFEHVFETGEKVIQSHVEKLISGIKMEFDNALVDLNKKVLAECHKTFESQTQEEGTQGLWRWFQSLAEEKKNYLHHGEPGILIEFCRSNLNLEDDSLLKLAERMTGLSVASWADDMVLKFSAKLDSAKKYIDTFIPPHPPPPTSVGAIPPSTGQVALTLNLPGGTNDRRIFEVVSNLSPNGQALENMLNTTVEQIGKSLDEKEKLAVLYRFLNRHLFGATPL